ncbi:MAG: M15 family metallopeptidase [Oscillospiraceae bacterium]|nr:M15 family metallopeptidase [Oscillospiraceae bacterium]
MTPKPTIQKIISQSTSPPNGINANLKEEDYFSFIEDFGFKTNLSEYDKYMNPENRDEYLVLINSENPLAYDYTAADMIEVKDTRPGWPMQRLREYPAKALEALLIEARANGFSDITVTSAYRSYDLQTSLFNNEVAKYPNLGKEDAIAKAATVVAMPGTSEHQSGLCLDMHNKPAADVSFAKTDQAKWLAANCYKFGFILRYPEDKADITGISFEPWHFRYVGRYHATQMVNLKMCFEEYMEYLK